MITSSVWVLSTWGRATMSEYLRPSAAPRKSIRRTPGRGLSWQARRTAPTNTPPLTATTSTRALAPNDIEVRESYAAFQKNLAAGLRMLRRVLRRRLGRAAPTNCRDRL